MAVFAMTWASRPIGKAEFARIFRPLRQELRSVKTELAGADAVLAALPDPILLVNENRVIIRTNAAAESLFDGGFLGKDLAQVIDDAAILDATSEILTGA